MMPRQSQAPIVGVVGVIGSSSNAFGTGIGIAVLVGEAAAGTASRGVRRVTLPVQRRVVEPAVRSVVDLSSREIRVALARADHLVDVLVPAVISNLMSRVDIAQLLEDNVDLDRLAMDVIAAVDLPRIIRESSGAVTSEAVRGVRAQSMEADQAISRVVDRMLLRRRGRTAVVDDTVVTAVVAAVVTPDAVVVTPDDAAP